MRSQCHIATCSYSTLSTNISSCIVRNTSRRSEITITINGNGTRNTNAGRTGCCIHLRWRSRPHKSRSHCSTNNSSLIARLECDIACHIHTADQSQARPFTYQSLRVACEIINGHGGAKSNTLAFLHGTSNRDNGGVIYSGYLNITAVINKAR